MGSFLTTAAAVFLICASFGAQASECAQPIYRGRINPANILTFWKDRTGTLELVQGNKKRSYNFYVSVSNGYVTESLVISTDKDKLPSHTPNSRILFFGRNFSLAPKRGTAPFIVTSDLHQAFYHWAIQLSDHELGALLPDTAWKLVGCSKTEPKLYKPAQDARMAQDPLETWKRTTEAGQYWVELLAKVKSHDLEVGQAVKQHRARFPHDGGPIRSEGPPSAADARGLLGDMPQEQAAPPARSLYEPERPPVDWRTWEPSRGRKNMPPEGQKLLDALHAGQITPEQFRDGHDEIGYRETQERKRRRQ